MKKITISKKAIALLTLLLASIGITTSLSANQLQSDFQPTLRLAFQIEADDETAVLQKSIDLPDLQQFFPKNTDGSYKQVYIMQFPVVFSSTVSLTKFNQPVLFKTRDEILSSNPEGFLAFKTFSITGESATVAYDFIYNRSTPTAKLASVKLSLSKTGDTWNIIDSSIETH